MKNLKKVLLTGTITIAAMFAMTINSHAATVKVTGEVINIRKSPSTDASVVAMLSKGVECEYLGEEGDWYKIKYKRYTGYVSKQYVSLEGATSNNEDTNKIDEKTDNETNSNSDSKNENQDNTDKNDNKNDNSNSNNQNSSNNSEQNNDTTKADENNSQPVESTKLTYKKFNQNTVVRILPLIYSSEIENIEKDKEVLILAETSGWTYVQADEISGWVRTDTLGESKSVEAGSTSDKTNEEDNTEAYTEKTGYVSVESVNLRKGAGTGSKVLKTLTLNTEVTITGEEDDWYKVKSGSTAGYILKEYVSDSKKVTSRSLSEPRKNTEEDKKKEDKKDDKKTTDKKTTDKKTNTTTSNKDKNKDNKKDKNTTNKTTKKTGYINEKYVNIREGAGTKYKVSKVLKLNDEVTIVGEKGDWYKVTSRTITGYILKEYVSEKKKTTTSDKDKTTTSNKDKNTTSDKKTNTSTNNNKNNNKTNTSNKTQTTTTNKTETNTSNKTQTNTSNKTETNTSNESSVRGSDIVAYAKKFLGCRYVYAGNGPTSFDCSGFTCYVFKHFGVSLPRTVSGQYYSGKGTKITKISDLKVGDIVCFRDYSSGNAFGHCGIYIGGGQFIHASTTNYKVRISDLSGTYSNRFCGGLRVFK